MNNFWWLFYNTAWMSVRPFFWVLKKTGKKIFFRPIGGGLPTSQEVGALLSPEPYIWIHALSLGEVNSSVPLVTEFRKRGYRVIFSAGTESGFVAAHRIMMKGGKGNIVDMVLPMPIDAPWVMRVFVRSLKTFAPLAAIFVETDIWPNILKLCRMHKIPTVLVNARMRPSSYRLHGIASKFGVRLLDCFDVIFAASFNDARRMARLVTRPEIVKYSGNIKWDAAVNARWTGEQIRRLRHEIGLDPGRPVWIAGSIHAGEEGTILEVHRRILDLIPEALLIVAPRKLELASEIISKCDSEGIAWGLRSRSDKTENVSVYVVDTYGELSGFYGLCRCAFVGGSLVSFGGHNPLEPAVYGIPVCWGPHIFNFEEIAGELSSKSIGFQVKDGQELLSWVSRYIKSSKKLDFSFFQSPSRRIADFVLENFAFSHKKRH